MEPNHDSEDDSSNNDILSHPPLPNSNVETGPLEQSLVDQVAPSHAPEKPKDDLPQPETAIPPTLSPSAPVFRLNQPFKILTDIWGVLTSNHFRCDLFRYREEQMAPYLVKHFHRAEVQKFLEELVLRNIQDRVNYPQLPIIGMADCCDDKQSKVKAIVENLRVRRESKDKTLVAGLDGLDNQIWTDGYRRKTLRPHAFSDVIPAFSRWYTEPYFIKVHTFASGPSEHQKLFLSACAEGDVSHFITSGIDAHSHYKYDWTKYKAVLTTLDERIPANLLYLTDSPNKAKPAVKAGMTVFIVRREGNRKRKEADLASYRVIDSLEQLDFIPADH